MTMNLIEQQNILKGLTDEALQQALSSPNATPPYLIATEIGRRKDMRQRYEGEQARRGKQSTVLEDLLNLNGAMPAGTPAAPMGGAPMAQAATATPEQGAPTGIAAFAEGGLVGGGGGLDYAALSERYNTAVNARPQREDRARALALLMAGAGMMGGGSSNTLTNIGKGIGAGASYYGDALTNIDTQEREALRDAMDLERIRNAEDLQLMEFGWRKDESAADRAMRERELAAGRKPASVVESEWYLNATPEEQAAFDRLNPQPTIPSSEAARLKEFGDMFQESFKAIPDPAFITPGEEAKVVADKTRQAHLLTYEKIKAIYGPDVANLYARNAGMSDGDVLTSAPSSPAAGGAVSYTDYFTD